MQGCAKTSWVAGALLLVSLSACDSNNDNARKQSGSSHGDVGMYAYTDGSNAASEYDGMDGGDILHQPSYQGGYDPLPKKSPNHPVVRSYQQKYSQLINREAKKQGMDPFFIHAIISQESRYKPNVTSHAGAGGIMQIMPHTARGLGISDGQRYTPEAAVPAGIKYLRSMMKWSNGNIQAMATGYNSGPARGKALFLRNTNSRYWSGYGEQPSTPNGVPSPKFQGGETYNYAKYVAWFYELYKANPHLVGMADVQASHEGSGCMAREIC